MDIITIEWPELLGLSSLPVAFPSAIFPSFLSSLSFYFVSPPSSSLPLSLFSLLFLSLLTVALAISLSFLPWVFHSQCFLYFLFWSFTTTSFLKILPLHFCFSVYIISSSLGWDLDYHMKVMCTFNLLNKRSKMEYLYSEILAALSDRMWFPLIDFQMGF